MSKLFTDFPSKFIASHELYSDELRYFKVNRFIYVGLDFVLHNIFNLAEII